MWFISWISYFLKEYLIIDKRRKAKGRKWNAEKNYHQDVRCHREIKKARLIFISGITEVRPHGCQEKNQWKERERERGGEVRVGYFSPDSFQTSKTKTKMGEERTTSTATNGCSDNSVVSYWKLLRKGTSHFQITSSIRWRAHAMQEVGEVADGGHILIKRLLSWKLEYYCESRRPKFRGTTVAAPPTDATLQACLAPGLRLSEISAIWRRVTFTNRYKILEVLFGLKMAI